MSGHVGSVAPTGRRARALVAALAIGWMSLVPLGGVALAQAAGQEHAASAAAPEHAAAGEAQGQAEHGGGWLSAVWPVANFVVLAGGLWYLLRKPTANYLEARADQIKGGLQDASAMRAQASARLQDIEARVKGLPAEIDRLKARGAEEVAAERARIREAAQIERQRLMEQARRDIDLQLQAARRDLTTHAANLAVDLAEKRIEREITAADHRRLVDRYVERMGEVHE